MAPTTLIKQAKHDPFKFILTGYMCFATDENRFGGRKYLVDLPDGLCCIYARRNHVTGLIEIMTGIRNWQPEFKEIGLCTIDTVTVYLNGTENGPTDAYKRFNSLQQ